VGQAGGVGVGVGVGDLFTAFRLNQDYSGDSIPNTIFWTIRGTVYLIEISGRRLV